MLYHVRNILEHWCAWVCEIYKYIYEMLTLHVLALRVSDQTV